MFGQKDSSKLTPLTRLSTVSATAGKGDGLGL